MDRGTVLRTGQHQTYVREHPSPPKVILHRTLNLLNCGSGWTRAQARTADSPGVPGAGPCRLSARCTRVAGAVHRVPGPGTAPARANGPDIPASHCEDGHVTIAKSVLLFILAAAAEIGGAWLVWQAVREGKDWWWAGLGVLALGLYGFVATLQPDPHFGRILAAYGGVFVAGSLAWGMIFDGFRPDRWDVAGSAICLLGVAVIMFSPRSAG